MEEVNIIFNKIAFNYDILDLIFSAPIDKMVEVLERTIKDAKQKISKVLIFPVK